MMREADLAGELERLPDLDRDTLIAKWEALYGRAPPRYISRSLLIRAVAYKLQEQVFGGLSPAIRRQLLAPQTATASIAARPGTILVREWHGTTHQVTIVEEGAVYKGKVYKSLSQVARLITGSHWSGPAFFGLKTKKSKP